VIERSDCLQRAASDSVKRDTRPQRELGAGGVVANRESGVPLSTGNRPNNPGLLRLQYLSPSSIKAKAASGNSAAFSIYGSVTINGHWKSYAYEFIKRRT
jgi:hypothetical protein